MRRNLIIVRAGDRSIHPGWIDPGSHRDFDLLVSYYGNTADQFRAGSEHYDAETGPRWPAHARICREQWAILERYEHIAFACDDLEAPQGTWNALFRTCRRYGLDLAQPAIEGHPTHRITQPQRDCILRYTNFVEIMCPVFCQASLQKLRGTFGESISGWGLDFLWGSLLPYPQFKIAIIDSVRVRHTRPKGGAALKPALAALGVEPGAELERVRIAHGLGNAEPMELGRVPAGPVQRLLSRLRNGKALLSPAQAG
jgi:hypothetical protein